MAVLQTDTYLCLLVLRAGENFRKPLKNFADAFKTILRYPMFSLKGFVLTRMGFADAKTPLLKKIKNLRAIVYIHCPFFSITAVNSDI